MGQDGDIASNTENGDVILSKTSPSITGNGNATTNGEDSSLIKKSTPGEH